MTDEPHDDQPLAGDAPGGPAASGPAPGDEPAGGERRVRYTRRSFITIGIAALAGLIAFFKYGLGGSGSGPAAAGSSGALGKLGNFPINTADSVPKVPAADWVVTVDGLVEQPLRLDRAAWLALARRDETVDFHCVEGWTVDNVVWGGVAPATLFAAARPKPAGKFVTFHAHGGVYIDSLTMAEALESTTLLVDTMDGSVLPAEHGGPLRLIVPNQMGYKSVKWVERIEVTDTQATGYWETQGYAVEAPV